MHDFLIATAQEASYYDVAVRRVMCEVQNYVGPTIVVVASKVLSVGPRSSYCT